MTLLNKSLLSIFVALSFTLATVHISSAPITKLALNEELAAKSQEIKYLQGEISFTQQRRKRAQEKLQTYEQDIVQKNQQFKALQKKYADIPSLENEQLMHNEQQRIALAELGMKSRVAEVVRLESKEIELNAQLSALEADVAEISQAVAIKKPQAQIINKEMTAELETLARRLQVLQRENERLRQVALAETQKREDAEMRVISLEKRLAELDLMQSQSSSNDRAGASNQTENALLDSVASRNLDDAPLIARAAAKNEVELMMQAANGQYTGTSAGISLQLKGADGTDYGLFQYLGAQQYRAEVVMSTAESFFKVAGRTYKVTVPESAIGTEYILLCDLSEGESPRLVSFQKTLLNADSVAAK